MNGTRDEARERAQFEAWAAESFGGDINRTPFGNLLDRDSRFTEEYKFADVQAAWGAWQFARAAGERAGLERAAELLPQLDREHGGHLAESIRALAVEGEQK